MEYGCFRCVKSASAEEWNHATKECFGEDSKPIEQGFGNRNWTYVCPSCGKLCYAPDIFIPDDWADEYR